MHKHANSEKTTRSGAVKIGTDLLLVAVSKLYAGFFELLNIFVLRAFEIEKWPKTGKNRRFSSVFWQKMEFFSEFPKTPHNVFVGSLVGTAYQILALECW